MTPAEWEAAAESHLRAALDRKDWDRLHHLARCYAAYKAAGGDLERRAAVTCFNNAAKA